MLFLCDFFSLDEIVFYLLNFVNIFLNVRYYNSAYVGLRLSLNLFLFTVKCFEQIKGSHIFLLLLKYYILL